MYATWRLASGPCLPRRYRGRSCGAATPWSPGRITRHTTGTGAGPLRCNDQHEAAIPGRLFHHLLHAAEQGVCPQGISRGVVPRMGERVVLPRPTCVEAVVRRLREGVPHRGVAQAAARLLHHPSPGQRCNPPLPSPWAEGLGSPPRPCTTGGKPPAPGNWGHPREPFRGCLPCYWKTPGVACLSSGLPPGPAAHAHGKSDKFGGRSGKGQGHSGGHSRRRGPGCSQPPRPTPHGPSHQRGHPEGSKSTGGGSAGPAPWTTS